ncbi:flagellin N-terminal helical domain-containing protein [Tepidimicrobium xylanilyticum]|uniref:Flagellin n=1 Tax=Tepidimicrobium xylanilyticum TaxID=1123352 RepID=A0A1H2QSX9_9FIRM|nr:flagellin [Tepidimicrobium xylanilyticum]GMG95586.1 flagellin [Tepidimicrobium xylanilyticum]SDW10283.1 flagellin [Tepidimicrobium xylanilyticum]
MSNMVINNNLLAINAHRALKLTGGVQSKAVEKLSSGLRINRAADDAAGLAISEKMRAQIRGLNQASRNAQDGISLIQTAEGAINETHAILQRMRELAVQAANGTYQDEDRALIQKEVAQLIEELDDITVKTEFNGMKLVDGSLSGEITFHVGPNEDHAFSVSMVNAKASELGVADVDISTQSGAQKAITTINDAIIKVAEFRAELGAVQNRLEHTIKNIDISAENLQAAESRIRDTDMAKEMMNFVKSNILQQAATSMLAQANQAPQMVLQLLK